MTRTGIIAPMPVEAGHLVPPSAMKSVQTINGFPMYQWKMGAHDVSLACSGIGMRRAAQAATHLIENCRVERILVSGVAGGLAPGACTGALVLPETVRSYNHAATGGFIAHGPMAEEAVGPSYHVDAALRDDALAVAGRLPAGGLLVSVRGLVTSVPLLGWFHESLSATAVDMESAAVAGVCADAGVPFLVVRAFSDRAPELARWDWPRLAQARRRGRRAMTSHLIRHPALAARLWKMTRDVNRSAESAARVVKGVLGFRVGAR